MGRETGSASDCYLEELERRKERKRALNSCYMNPDRIGDCLENELITLEEAKEVRRSYLFEGSFRGDYPLELDAALRRGDITYPEYCNNTKRYYLRRNQAEGEMEGLADFWEMDLSRKLLGDDEEDYFDGFFPEEEPPKEKQERFGEFDKIDYRSPYSLSEMRDVEIESAARLFYLIEKRSSGLEGITKPLEFLEELTLNGFRLPKNLHKVLLESRNHDEFMYGPFEMSKLRFTRFRNKVRRYSATFWFNLFFNCPNIYEDFWEKTESRSKHLVIK